MRKQLKEAVEHLTFAVYMCLKQASEGRKFMFEHPFSASSWQLALVNQLLFLDGAERVNFDFCALGMTIEENGMPTPVKKRTSVVANSKMLIQALRMKQCKGDHTHANTMGGKIKQCQVYPPAFCSLLQAHVYREGQVLHGFFELFAHFASISLFQRQVLESAEHRARWEHDE